MKFFLEVYGKGMIKGRNKKRLESRSRNWPDFRRDCDNSSSAHFFISKPNVEIDLTSEGIATLPVTLMVENESVK